MDSKDIRIHELYHCTNGTYTSHTIMRVLQRGSDGDMFHCEVIDFHPDREADDPGPPMPDWWVHRSWLRPLDKKATFNNPNVLFLTKVRKEKS